MPDPRRASALPQPPTFTTAPLTFRLSLTIQLGPPIESIGLLQNLIYPE